MGYHFGAHKRRDTPTGNRKEGISSWENDKTYPDVQSLLLLSQLFEVSVDELVRGDVVAMQQAIAEDSRILLAGLLLALEG